MRDVALTSASSSGIPMPELPMISLQVFLSVQEHNLTLLMPESEWTKLVNDFKRMPVDERQRFGNSIRNATAHDPFPVDGASLSPHQQEVCDVFVSDCVLLAALAEVSGPRVLLETAVDSYRIVRGNLAKQGFN